MLDFGFTIFTGFTKVLFFTILKEKFFTFTDLPACRTHAYDEPRLRILPMKNTDNLFIMNTTAI